MMSKIFLIITDYMIYSKIYINEKDLQSSYKSFINSIKEYNKNNEKLNKHFFLNNFFIARNEKLFRKLYKNKNKKIEKNLIDSNLWDYNYNNAIACRIDNNNNVNIYAVSILELIIHILMLIQLKNAHYYLIETNIQLL